MKIVNFQSAIFNSPSARGVFRSGGFSRRKYGGKMPPLLAPVAHRAKRREESRRQSRQSRQSR
jgi:hypothetical protein